MDLASVLCTSLIVSCLEWCNVTLIGLPNVRSIPICPSLTCVLALITKLGNRVMSSAFTTTSLVPHSKARGGKNFDTYFQGPQQLSALLSS